MIQNNYLEKINKKFERNFKIEKDIEILGEKIDLCAKFCNVNGRTFITQNDVIDRYENYEYCYMKKFKNITVEDIYAYGQLMKNIVDKYIEPGNDHMSTYVTGVLVGERIDSKAKKAAREYKYSRIYSFYLKGWCDVRLICVDTSCNEIITNVAGKKVQKVYMTTP